MRGREREGMKPTEGGSWRRAVAQLPVAESESSDPEDHSGELRVLHKATATIANESSVANDDSSAPTQQKLSVAQRRSAKAITVEGPLGFAEVEEQLAVMQETLHHAEHVLGDVGSRHKAASAIAIGASAVAERLTEECFASGELPLDEVTVEELEARLQHTEALLQKHTLEANSKIAQLQFEKHLLEARVKCLEQEKALQDARIAQLTQVSSSPMRI
jgi:hypothetical protein